MTAAWMWARADVRQRWRAWVVLGLLAGATAGLAAAGVAGARRTADAVPRFVAASGRIDAAVLPNDPAFDVDVRERVASLPEVRADYPFQVPFALEVSEPEGIEASLLPTTARTMDVLTGVVLEGRAPDPSRADEAVVDENLRDAFGLRLGSTLVVEQVVADEMREPLDIPPGNFDFRAELRVVGITKSTSEEVNWMPSSGFYERHESQLVGPVNMFALLDHGEADFARFQEDVERVTGRPTNVIRASDLLGLRKLGNVTDLEKQGLLLFSLAVVLGGGVLVGQALVRAVSAGASELPTWRAIGADRRTVVAALVAPVFVVAAVGAVTAVAVAIAISGRFPIGVARRYELDPGLHADWLILGLGALGVAAVAIVTAWLSAEWRLARREAPPSVSTSGAWANRAGLPSAMAIGTRLAVEPGRGRRAVPVRSALVGAIAGLLGVVACFTFRAAIDDVVDDPQRSGVVWDFGLVSVAGPIAPVDLDAVRDDPDVAAALDAVWARSLPVEGVGVPTFGTTPLEGDIPFVVLEGRAPRADDELAVAPSTLDELGLHIGDEVEIGAGQQRRFEVVGEALLPPTSHTTYDQGLWMTGTALERALPPEEERAPEDIWDLALVRWKRDARVGDAEERLSQIGGGSYYPVPAELPSEVVELGRLRSLPLALGIFFGLLGMATVAHALVTTVSRRRHDLAVMRTLGLTLGQTRLAIAWQSTLFAVGGVVVGVPLGVAAARVTWRWLAESYPLVYVAPLALAAVLLAIPVALVLANALAAVPAQAVVRSRPAASLRVE